MTTKELCSILNISNRGLLEAARRIFPDKIIQHGVATEWDENEVALLTHELQHTSSNNSSVDTEVFTGKSFLLDFLELLQKYNLQVNLQVNKSYILENITEQEARTLLLNFQHLISAPSVPARFKAGIAITDVLDNAVIRGQQAAKKEVLEYD